MAVQPLGSIDDIAVTPAMFGLSVIILFPGWHEFALYFPVYLFIHTFKAESFEIVIVEPS